jgi:ppGpp synthetase/RelA/SpoT-type nucleotidyltranferase
MLKKASTFDKASFEKEFNKRVRQFAEIKDEAEHSLRKKLDAAKIKFHSIPSRVKELDSCLAKIEKNQIEKPFDQMHDFVGLRVICLFLSDIPKIEELIKKIFVVIKSDNKVEGGDNTSFGYMSVHHIVRFGSKHTGERYDGIKNIPFEIQVRTIAMDAWANISHYLDYKTEQDIPAELKRDFHALSGMFYVADKHFQLFFDERLEKQKEIAKVFEDGSSKAMSDQPINLDTLTAFLNDQFSNMPSGGDSGMKSNLVYRLLQANYKTIGDISDILKKNQKAVSILRPYSTQIGIINLIFCYVNEKYFDAYRSQRPLPFEYVELAEKWAPFYRGAEKFLVK